MDNNIMNTNNKIDGTNLKSPLWGGDLGGAL
jgi:hypothetical protein